MTKTIISIPIYLSPIILFGILLETSANNAYLPEADSLGIPLFGYLFIYFPIALYLFESSPRHASVPQRLFLEHREAWI